MEQKRIPLTSPEAYNQLNTFGELALKWRVCEKTVKRWFKRLGSKAKLVVSRPSSQFVQISDEEAARFWKFVQAFWDDGSVIRRERIPQMIPVKASTPRQKRRK